MKNKQEIQEYKERKKEFDEAINNLVKKYLDIVGIEDKELINSLQQGGLIKVYDLADFCEFLTDSQKSDFFKELTWIFS